MDARRANTNFSIPILQLDRGRTEAKPVVVLRGNWHSRAFVLSVVGEVFGLLQLSQNGLSHISRATAGMPTNLGRSNGRGGVVPEICFTHADDVLFR